MASHVTIAVLGWFCLVAPIKAVLVHLERVIVTPIEPILKKPYKAAAKGHIHEEAVGVGTRLEHEHGHLRIFRQACRQLDK